MRFIWRDDDDDGERKTTFKIQWTHRANRIYELIAKRPTTCAYVVQLHAQTHQTHMFIDIQIGRLFFGWRFSSSSSSSVCSILPFFSASDTSVRLRLHQMLDECVCVCRIEFADFHVRAWFMCCIEARFATRAMTLDVMIMGTMKM